MSLSHKQRAQLEAQIVILSLTTRPVSAKLRVDGRRCVVFACWAPGVAEVHWHDSGAYSMYCQRHFKSHVLNST